MAAEIELKFLEIDPVEMERKIVALGARKVYDHTLRSAGFDGNGVSPRDSSKNYLRVRQIGEQTYLTFKGPLTDPAIAVRDELEVEVNDFAQTVKILERLGYNSRISEKRRIHYELGKIHFELEFYGNIPPYLEIEATTKEDLLQACAKLGLDPAQGKNLLIVELYPDKF